jgi:hypothetical protein
MFLLDSTGSNFDDESCCFVLDRLLDGSFLLLTCVLTLAYLPKKS